jgi:hypothetical protein
MTRAFTHPRFQIDQLVASQGSRITFVICLSFQGAVLAQNAISEFTRWGVIYNKLLHLQDSCSTKAQAAIF